MFILCYFDSTIQYFDSINISDVNQQLYDLFEIDAANIAHIREVLASKPK